MPEINAGPAARAYVPKPYEIALKTEKLVTVEIPEKDLLGHPYPAIRINGNEWGPGKHEIPQSFAKTVVERMNLYDHSRVELLQDKVDIEALARVRLTGTRNTKALA